MPAGKMNQGEMTRAIAKFTKTHGPGSIEIDAEFTPYEVVPTGSLDFDYALGVGGVVVGRCHEWWGLDGIGKSTMSYILMGEAQRAFTDRLVGYIDVEHKLDKPWMYAHDVDRKRTLLGYPETAEDTADVLKDMVRDFAPSLVVVDSIGAMIAEAEIEKDAGDAFHGGKKAQIVTRMVNIATAMSRRHNTAVLFINQVRANVDSPKSSLTTGGGWALKHCTTTKVRFSRTGTDPYMAEMSDGAKVQVGHEVALRIERNAVAPAYRTAMVSLFNQATEKYGPMGIDRATEAVTVGLNTGVVLQNSSYYINTLTGEQVQGRENFATMLREHPEQIAALREAIIATRAHEVHDEDETPTPSPPATKAVKATGKRSFKKDKDVARPAEDEVHLHPADMKA